MDYDEADPRQIRALALLSLGLTVERFLKNEWRMPSSQKEGGVYRIRRGRNQWSCTCKDHRIRGLLCKHIHAVRFHLASEKGERLDPIKKDPLPKAPRRTRSQTDKEVKKPKCPYCAGLLVNRYGRPNGKQAWWCKHCLRKFIPDDGFKRLKGNAQTITLALDLYFKGLSLRQITDYPRSILQHPSQSCHGLPLAQALRGYPYRVRQDLAAFRGREVELR